MANKEDVLSIIEKLQKAHPSHVLERTQNDNRGMNYVIKYLANHEGFAYTNEISKDMNISTARVSSLINKLEMKGIVIRKQSEKDARKTLIVLTEKGNLYHKKQEEKMFNMLSNIIDEFGIEELNKFFDTLDRLLSFMVDDIKNNQDEKEI